MYGREANRLPVEVQVVQQAYRFALDPTPSQERMLRSHAGARRYVYNWTHAAITEAAGARQAQKDAGQEPTVQIPGQFDLGPVFTRFKNTAVGCRRCRALLARAVTIKAADLEPAHVIRAADPDGFHHLFQVRDVTAALDDGDVTVIVGSESRPRLVFGAADDVPVQGLWMSARDGARRCAAAAGENAPHDPTRVSCDRCWDVLDDETGEWRDRDGLAACPEAKSPCGPHEPRSEFLAWAGDVFSGSMQAAMRDADTAWKRFLGGKARHPRFKRKGKCAESFQVHGDGLRMAETLKAIVNEGHRPAKQPGPQPKNSGRASRRERRRPVRRRTRERGSGHSGATVRQQTAHHIVLPKIGPVAVMSDDSLHPAMARSRKRAAPGAGRHMGNRRRARSLARHLNRTPAKASELAALLRGIRHAAGLDPDRAVAALNQAADARARAAAAAKAAELEAAAQALLAAAGDRELRGKALVKLRYAQKKAESAPKAAASRTDRWDAAKLARLEADGVATGGLDQARVICEGYGLGAADEARLMPLAAQARIIRATITLGADGLWWCSVGAEIPCETRTGPTRRQNGAGKCGSASWQPRRAPGPGTAAVVGIDFGVREVMTVSNGTAVPNPRHLEAALAELRHASRRLSRSQPGSARREDDRRLVGLIHADIARLRGDALHRATTMLVRSHAVIAAEGWNVQQVMRDGSKGVPRRVRRDRNRALADTGIGIGREQLKYKGPRAGAVIMITDPDARTGATCSLHRTARTTPLAPGEELFTSDKCGCVRPRRQNTAQAVAEWAARELKRGPSRDGPVKPRGGDGRPAAVRRSGHSPAKRAAGTRLGRGETGTPGG
jgi:transposase